MSVWMAAKQALTAMDLVTREWASAMGLDECGVLVLILLAERPSRPAWNLALYSGRARQQVQRSLRMMEEQALVCPAARSEAGRTTAWMLTERGVRLWKCLEPGLEEWDEMLGRILDVEELRRMLERMTESFVNRPGADGWRRGLLVPHDLFLSPLEARMKLAGLADEEQHSPEETLVAETEVPPPTPPTPPTVDPRVAAARANLEQLARETPDEQLRAILRRLLDD